MFRKQNYHHAESMFSAPMTVTFFRRNTYPLPFKYIFVALDFILLFLLPCDLINIDY